MLKTHIVVILETLNLFIILDNLEIENYALNNINIENTLKHFIQQLNRINILLLFYIPNSNRSHSLNCQTFLQR